MEILFAFVFFVGGGWLFGKIVRAVLIPKSKDYNYPIQRESKIIINNYTTENHLHISKEELRELNSNI